MGSLEIQQYVIGIAIFSATLQYDMTDHEFQYIAIASFIAPIKAMNIEVLYISQLF